MEAAELRIGNYVMDGLGDFAYQKIRSIQPHYSNQVTIDYNGVDVLDRKLSEIKPIELTSVWLVKLGATKEDEYYIIEGFKIFWSDNDGHKSFYHINSDTITHFDSVHHLQNYYYFMTFQDGNGEELTIKEL